MFCLHASLRWTSDNKKWSVIAAGQNITNSRVVTQSRLANQEYTMRVWMEYPNASLTAIYRIGGFKKKVGIPGTNQSEIFYTIQQHVHCGQNNK